MNRLFTISLLTFFVGYATQFVYPSVIFFISSGLSLVLMIGSLYQSLSDNRIRKKHLYLVK